MEESSDHQHDVGDDMEVNGQAQEGHSGSVGPAAGLSQLLDDLSCPICMSLLRDPFVTSCGHTFCCSCLSTHLEARSTCPSCGQYLIRDHTYPNFLLSKVRHMSFVTHIRAPCLPHSFLWAAWASQAAHCLQHSLSQQDLGAFTWLFCSFALSVV